MRARDGHQLFHLHRLISICTLICYLGLSNQNIYIYKKKTWLVSGRSHLGSYLMTISVHTRSTSWNSSKEEESFGIWMVSYCCKESMTKWKSHSNPPQQPWLPSDIVWKLATVVLGFGDAFNSLCYLGRIRLP